MFIVYPPAPHFFHLIIPCYPVVSLLARRHSVPLPLVRLSAVDTPPLSTATWVTTSPSATPRSCPTCPRRPSRPSSGPHQVTLKRCVLDSMSVRYLHPFILLAVASSSAVGGSKGTVFCGLGWHIIILRGRPVDIVLQWQDLRLLWPSQCSHLSSPFSCFPHCGPHDCNALPSALPAHTHTPATPKVEQLWADTRGLMYALDDGLRTLGLGADGVSTYYSSNCTKRDAETVQVRAVWIFRPFLSLSLKNTRTSPTTHKVGIRPVPHVSHGGTWFCPLIREIVRSATAHGRGRR